MTRRILPSILLILAPPAVFAAYVFAGFHVPASVACGGTGFLHCRTVTWDSSQAGTADTTSFPGYVSATNADWATAANGGVVQNTVNQSGSSYTSTIPADFIAASDSTCATQISGVEFISYTATTGQAKFFVNVATLSHTANTVIYICYDKASVATQQGSVNAAWDSNYIGVWHLEPGSNSTDSTSNGNTWTVNGTPGNVAGQLGQALDFSGGGEWLSRAAVSLGANTTTLEAWVWSATMTTAGTGVFLEHSPVNSMWMLFNSNGTLTVRGGNVNNQVQIAGMGNSTWYSTAGTITGTSGVGYLNGVATSHAIDAFTDASGSINAGRYDNGAGGGFSGTLDELRISKVVRAASYFTARYNQEKTGQSMVTIGAEQ